MPERAHPEGRLKVLAVDDHKDVLTLLRIIVQEWGHECLTAGSAKAARELLQHESPDVLLLDVTMPHVDGVTFLGQLRKEGLEPRHVALLSALPTEQLRKLSAELGVPFIQKPFTGPSLRESFERLFGLCL